MAQPVKGQALQPGATLDVPEPRCLEQEGDALAEDFNSANLFCFMIILLLLAALSR